ncbi:MAG: hypothetical protein AUG51_16155 [Acidobacteria bacterium 13_1_20CM_3_53_8]|nr:MAG: hypothetical protein AUG51_16155 [Acidobacteria bacterium 13_1_20CM_3_53_8]
MTRIRVKAMAISFIEIGVHNMDQPPTRAEFNELKHRFEQLERETEPMRLERRLSIPEANTLQKIMDQVGTMTPDVAQLKIDMQGVKADIKAIKETMATKEDIDKRLDAIAKVQQLILDRLPKPPETNE